jgi:hypothetical protein
VLVRMRDYSAMMGGVRRKGRRSGSGEAFLCVEGESVMGFVLVGWVQVQGGVGVGFGHFGCGEFGVLASRTDMGPRVLERG